MLERKISPSPTGEFVVGSLAKLYSLVRWELWRILPGRGSMKRIAGREHLLLEGKLTQHDLNIAIVGKSVRYKKKLQLS